MKTPDLLLELLSSLRTAGLIPGDGWIELSVHGVPIDEVRALGERWSINEFPEGDDHPEFTTAEIGGRAVSITLYADTAKNVIKIADPPPPTCSICRRRHGSEVQHACE